MLAHRWFKAFLQGIKDAYRVGLDLAGPVDEQPAARAAAGVEFGGRVTLGALELARGSRGVTTPVPCVYLPVSLTAPGSSGSTEPTRLCRGCSRPHRRPPARTSSSFTPPLRRRGDGRAFTSNRNSSGPWRTQARLSCNGPLRPGNRHRLRA